MIQIEQFLSIGLLILSGFANLVIGIYIYLFAYKLSNGKYLSARYFSYICFAIFNWSLWVGLRTIYFYPMESIWGVYVSNVIIYLSIVTVVQSLVFFAIAFNTNIRQMKKYQFFYYPYIFILMLILIPNWGVFNIDIQYPVNYKSAAYYMFLVYIISYMFLYGTILRHRYKSADNAQSRTNMLLVLIGTVLSLLTAFVTNVLIPFLYSDLTFVYYGPVATLFLSFMVIFAMLKYKLFHIKLPIAGLLITLIITIILLIVRFFLVDGSSITSVQFNFLVIFMFGFLYIFLTREVYLGAKNQLLLDSKQRQLETILDSKNDFLKNSSHQFRTPLTVILGYLGMIINKENPKYDLNQIAIDDLSKTYASAKNLNEIINDVLDSNDVNTGRFGINIRDDINLVTLIEDIIDEKNDLLDQKETTVKIRSIGKEFDAFVDRGKLKEGLNNIIDNAIFYGNGKITINIDSKDKKFFQIQIKDNGVGISRAEAQNIWKKFERGKKSALINPNGSGLGLYLTKQIMIKHGGDVVANSEGRNKGSIFTLTIPKDTRKYAPSDSFGINVNKNVV